MSPESSRFLIPLSTERAANNDRSERNNRASVRTWNRSVSMVGICPPWLMAAEHIIPELRPVVKCHPSIVALCDQT